MADDFTIKDRPGVPTGQAVKTPVERRLYTFDYSNWLDDGETVTGFDAAVVPQTSNVNLLPILVDTISITTDGSAAAFYAGEGVEGNAYQVRLIASTSINRIKEDGLIVKVVSEDGCGCAGSGGSGGNPPPQAQVAPVGIYAEQLIITAFNALPDLTYPAWDGATTMQLIVNGRVFSGCVAPPPFVVAGAHVAWTSSFYSIAPGDEVVASYRYVTAATPSAQVVVMSLYYIAVQGQTVFPLGIPDRFGQHWTLDTGATVNVHRTGGRLMPSDGAGNGSYLVASNTVTLLYPAGVGETIVIDILEQTNALIGPAP